MRGPLSLGGPRVTAPPSCKGLPLKQAEQHGPAWAPPTYVLTRTRAMVPVEDGGRKRGEGVLLLL